MHHTTLLMAALAMPLTAHAAEGDTPADPAILLLLVLGLVALLGALGSLGQLRRNSLMPPRPWRHKSPKTTEHGPPQSPKT